MLTKSWPRIVAKTFVKYQIKLFYTPPLHIQTMLADVNMPKMPLKCLTILENSRKSSKIAKNTRFYPKVKLEYFSNYCRYGSNIFGGSKHSLWVVFEPTMACLTHPPAKTSSHLVNSCLFGRFWGTFDPYKGIGQQLVNICWPKFWKMLTNP